MHFEKYFTIHSHTDIYILAIFASALLVQLIYYLFFYVRTSVKPKPTKKNNMPISVIISARNEAENLKQFLPLVMAQDYPDYELIVVDDRSADNTSEVLVEMRSRYPNLYFTTIEENRHYQHGKKLALTVGIKAAKHPTLVFTDADCFPVSDKWLQSIVDGYHDKKELVLAYGGYEKQKGFLNRMIRFDTLWIAMQYLSFAKAGVPYMGVGRNLSYTKSLYESQKGFSAHYHIKSGDDDLFVNRAATKKNTATVCRPESITRSLPETKFNRWLLQKVRHFATAPHYRFGHKVLLSGEIISRFLFYAMIPIAVLLKAPPAYVVAFFVFRLIIQYIVFGLTAKRLDEKGIAFLLPFFDVFMPLVHLRIAIAGIFIGKRKRQLWK